MLQSGHGFWSHKTNGLLGNFDKQEDLMKKVEVLGAG
jgi:hypothetical protein